MICSVEVWIVESVLRKLSKGLRNNFETLGKRPPAGGGNALALPQDSGPWTNGGPLAEGSGEKPDQPLEADPVLPSGAMHCSGYFCYNRCD